MKTRVYFLVLGVLMPLIARAQTGATLQGKVLDSFGISIPLTAVQLLLDSTVVRAEASDFSGDWKIQNVVPGKYDLRFSSIGYQTVVKKNLNVEAKKTIIVDMIMEPSTVSLNMIQITGERTPVFVKGKTERSSSFSRSDMLTLSPGETGNIRGARNNATVYVDGVKVMRGNNTSPEPVDEKRPEPTENIYLSPFQDPLSTFSIDVDKASYTIVRSHIDRGMKPDGDAVRIEEMINYFEYSYPQPTGEHPFSITTETSANPWNKNTRLVMIGLQGKKIDFSDSPPANLVFLIDVSGSMSDYNKLPLVKTSVRALVGQLRDVDHVSIVVYAGAAGVVLEPTAGSNKQKILDAIERLNAGGSTAGGEGIRLAYATGRKHFLEGGNNRVILATDGDFNVGISDDEALIKMIESERESGIFLTVLGYGMGNYKDAKMEKLADKGNGNYAYIDSQREAEKVLVKELSGTMNTIASDVKLQVEFNPAVVKGYRLIGYDNRRLENWEFNDDTRDAGELGAGHSVTALYEVELVVDSVQETDKMLKYQSGILHRDSFINELLTVKFRYKIPGQSTSILLESVLKKSLGDFEEASEGFRFASAVAGFGLLLRDPGFCKKLSFSEILKIAGDARGIDTDGNRSGFVQLVSAAKTLY